MTDKRVSMSGKITALPFFIIVFSFLISGLFIISNILNSEEKRITEQAMLVAQTVGKLPELPTILENDALTNQQKATKLKKTIRDVRTTNKIGRAHV